MTDRKYTMDELSEKTGVSRRTVRYYIQEGLLAPPAGRGRGGFYFDSHVDRLLAIKACRGRGIPLAAVPGAIDALPAAGQPETAERTLWARYALAPGVELHVSREFEARRGRKTEEAVRVLKAMLAETEERDGVDGE